MTYKRYHLRLIVRIICLVGNVFLTGGSYLLIGERDILFLPLTLTIVLALQVVDLILYLNRLGREIARFVDNISQQDLSEKFDEKSTGPPFRDLYHSLNRVIAELEGIRLEKEAQYNYLQALLGHIPTGIISIRDRDEIILINDSAREMLGLPEPYAWSGFKTRHPALVSEVEGIRGRGKKLAEITVNGVPRHLSLTVGTIRMLGSRYRIITLQDIHTEIEQTEIEAWHKLIQVLRHEIRNSVTPIASMSETILMLVEDQYGNAKEPSELGKQDVEDIHSSIRTVHDRSERLYSFVEKYRQLTRIPQPVKEWIRVRELFSGMARLFRKEAASGNIRIVAGKVDKDLAIFADPGLIEQVLINLIRNSIQALEGQAKGLILLDTKKTEHHVMISVEDDGPGIQPAELQDIFLPFYTTRENGSGIGLSLSRQIMNLHGGILTVDSLPGKKTVFSLVFNR